MAKFTKGNQLSKGKGRPPGSGYLAELLGPDDPAVIRNRGPGVTIARSYGMT